MAALAAPQVAAAAEPVLVVGDSLEVGTGPHLQRELRGSAVTVDARIGRPSDEALRVLSDKLRPEHRVVVFDVGVNDNPAQPAALAADLSRARRVAGDRCMVVATLERPPLNGVAVDGLDRAVREFASSDPNVQLVDWRAAARGRRGLLSPDGVHATPAGYVLRGRLVADAVRACLSGGAAADEPEPDLPALPRVEAAPRRPLLIDWGALARRRPVAGLFAIVAGGVDAVAGAAAAAMGAIQPGVSEPVLGRPE